MDLLSTILRSASFEEYLDAFKNNNIDSHTLKILNDQDLQLLGIQIEEKRKQFLKIINNLQIPSEKKISLKVDKFYALLVLTQISVQLQKHYANLIYIFKREDVDICDIQLTPAVISLQHVLDSMQAKINKFEQKVLKVPSKKIKKKIIIPTLIIASASLIFCCSYLLLNK